MFIPVEKYYTSETGEDLLLEFDCDVKPGTEEHFCNGHGNWLPGDLPEVKITAIRFDGKELSGSVFDFFFDKYVDLVKQEALKDAERAA